MITKNKLTFLLVFIFAFQGCNWMNQDPYKNTPTTGRIKICVDETFRPVAEAELQVFHAFYKYAEITPVFVPESEAFDLLLKDCTNLVIASRPLSEYERAEFKKKKLFPDEVKVAMDAIAVIINPMNEDSVMSLNDLKSILSGRITNWNQINSASKSGEIKVIFDHEKSGTVRYMIDSVLNGTPLAKNLFALDINTDVIKYVAENREAMGLIGVSWISDNDDTLQLSFLKQIKVLALSNENVATWQNSFQPYQAYIFDQSYPLIRNIYAIDTEPRNGLASGFLSFIASDKGQRIILKAGILPANSPIRVVKIKEDI